VDETDICTVPKPRLILEPKGQKQIVAAICWERGKNVTAVFSWYLWELYSTNANLWREANFPTTAKEWSNWRTLFLFSKVDY
jgi:hypothetical protein